VDSPSYIYSIIQVKRNGRYYDCELAHQIVQDTRRVNSTTRHNNKTFFVAISRTFSLVAKGRDVIRGACPGPGLERQARAHVLALALDFLC
jgi:hypothetical protein